jgi:DNA-binding CsgD family transcriptional regulator
MSAWTSADGRARWTPALPSWPGFAGWPMKGMAVSPGSRPDVLPTAPLTVAVPNPASLPAVPGHGPHVHIVSALKEMLRRAEGGQFDIAEETHDGVAFVHEHANVRCVLVVQSSGDRPNLSPRESQIAALIADGATNRLIASVLDISLWTVSTHIRRIFAKLGVNSRAEMVARLLGSPGG